MTTVRKSLVSIAMFAIVILAGLTAILGAALYSDGDGHLGDYGITIRSEGGGAERQRFFSKLAEFATANGFDVNIYYSSIDTSDGELRVYTSAVGRDDGRVERPRFERGRVDVLYPLEDFPVSDPRQNLLVKGSESDERNLIRWLEEQGLEVSRMQYHGYLLFSASTIPVLLALSVLLCFVLGAGHVFTRAREVGVHRLLGLGLAGTAAIELRRYGKLLAGIYIAASVAIALGLYAYNGWVLASIFWISYFLTSAILIVSLVSGYLGGQLLVRVTSVPQSIKGKIHARPVLYALIAVRSVALVVALSSVAALVGAMAELGARYELQDKWDAHRGPREFAVNANTAFEQQVHPRTIMPIRNADRAGALLLVDPYWLTWPSRLEAPVLLVNQEFARQAGAEPLDGSVVTVCSPVELSPESITTIEDALAFESSLASGQAPPIEWDMDCALGSVFTYDIDYMTAVDDPILVVFPSGLDVLGNHNLMSKISQQFLLSSSAEVPVQLTTGGTGAMLGYAKPRADSWQQRVRVAESQTVLWSVNTFAAIVLVTVLVATMILTFSIAYRRRIHIAYICGRSPWWVAKYVLAVEAIFLLVSLAWLLYQIRAHQAQAALRAPSTWNLGFESQWSLSTIAAVGIFAFIWTAASVSMTVRAAGRWDAREGTEPQ